ncbi:helix-turn-helix domain-containing protein [Thalassorhabdus alkalitolerans]|uniref:Helix-turn-helix domain-containing protein n=1 Tax=Thalassorhabdus alkalitolerans TaxID=2282697 RepID=A0ABW0YIZ9_9BACI
MAEIILIDDDVEARHSIKEVFKQSSYSYLSFVEEDSFEKGFELIKQREPIVLFLELSLPDGDGIELGKKVLRHYPNLPIVLLSQLQMFEPVHEAINAGFSGYLLKPVTKSEALQVLDRLLIKGLVREANDYVRQEKTEEENDFYPDRANPINTAMKYIHLNYQEPLTLKEVTNLVYLSPSHFSRMFKEETGVNFIEYLNQYRIEKSKGFLKMTSLPIEVIANNTGFSSAAYFATTFKRIEGVTPREYRNLFGNFAK